MTVAANKLQHIQKMQNALLEQLNLELVPAREKLDVLVVEKKADH